MFLSNGYTISFEVGDVLWRFSTVTGDGEELSIFLKRGTLAFAALRRNSFAAEA